MSNNNEDNPKSEKEDKSSDAEHLFVYATAKAGMNDVDKNKIQQIIYEASKGSAYFEQEQRKAAQVEEKMKTIKKQLKQISSTQIEQMQFQCNKYIQQIDNERDLSRTWIHCDMDMFYAAVAMRDNPSLKGKPIAIGSMSMISTTNYVARKFGVRAAMPGFIGKKLCPQLIFVKHDWNAYKEASNKVKAIVAEYDPNFTSGSLDEVYLDVTDYLYKHSQLSGGDIAKEIRNKIFSATQLTASAGVACNRMLSKIGSDMNKPNGQFILEHNSRKIKEFMNILNVRKIPGIGRVTQRILKEIGAEICSDVLLKAALVKMFFKHTTYEWLLRACYGIAMNKRNENEIYRRKSISQERTFGFKGISNEKELEKKIIEICDNLYEEIIEKKIKGKTITVKLKTTEFETKTRAYSLGFYTNDKNIIIKNAIGLLRKEYPIKLRLLGVRLSSLEQKLPQSKLQKQLNDFWKIEKKNANDSNDNVEGELKELIIDENNNKNKKKRKWNDMMDKDNIDNGNVNKRRKINGNVNEDIDMINSNNNLNRNIYSKNLKKDKMTISKMFEKVEKKNKEKVKQKYICPICNRFECLSNIQLNIHLDKCLRGNENKKKKKQKKKKKGKGKG
eukprot:538623_1